MKKILYITTLSSTINAFLIPHINMLRDKGYLVDCACSINQEIKKNELDEEVNIYNIPFKRNPLHMCNIRALKLLIRLQRQVNYDIVHVHTPTAGVYGRLLKIIFPKLKTIYTVHGFHFYKGAPKINWAIYYPIEKIMSKFTDTIITMNSEDYERAKRFKIKNIYNVNGVGLELSKYSLDGFDRNEIREKLNLQEDDFIILMIAEVNKNKNHKQMIDAIKILKNKGISNIKVLCAGDGPMLNKIKEYIKQVNLKDNIIMLGYREDINELIVSCDIGILMSYREGLPRNIMEFMACKKAVIGTDIRGIRDLIKDNINGYLVPVQDAEETANKIKNIYDDIKLSNYMGDKAYTMVQKYGIDNVIKQIEDIYR